jgi:hypothetical protein
VSGKRKVRAQVRKAKQYSVTVECKSHGGRANMAQVKTRDVMAFFTRAESESMLFKTVISNTLVKSRPSLIFWQPTMMRDEMPFGHDSRP